jgi:CRISPR/Cas system CSM-associated protein Csm5 (group 7 of RAMP superfamily)
MAIREKRPRFPVSVGWGGGWRSKTVGLLLDEARIRELANNFRLETWKKPRDFPRGFPVTRKLAPGPDGNLMPPGWLGVSKIEIR